jgi:hypothetical protein
MLMLMLVVVVVKDGLVCSMLGPKPGVRAPSVHVTCGRQLAGASCLPTLHAFSAKQAFAAKAHLLHVSVARTLRILTFIVFDLSKL